ncbi:MAG: hypothetical protein ACI959_002257 [Limisphaerales bacterium]|jgi:hypothetical protein
MSRMRIEAKPVNDLPKELSWLERLTGLMDTAFRIPFTNIRFGIDPIIGLIPGFGEFIPTLISGIMVITMARHGVGGMAVVQMMGNVILDFIVGLIPVIGDIFDLGYKSNIRNLNLLKAHYQEGKYRGSAWPAVILASVLLIALLALIVWGSAQLWTYFWSLF